MIRVKYYIYSNNIKYVILIPSDSMSFLQGKLRFTMNLQNDLRIMLTFVQDPLLRFRSFINLQWWCPCRPR